LSVTAVSARARPDGEFVGDEVTEEPVSELIEQAGRATGLLALREAQLAAVRHGPSCVERRSTSRSCWVSGCLCVEVAEPAVGGVMVESWLPGHDATERFELDGCRPHDDHVGDDDRVGEVGGQSCDEMGAWDRRGGGVVWDAEGCLPWPTERLEAPGQDCLDGRRALRAACRRRNAPTVRGAPTPRGRSLAVR
jgi:hypothetical protein